MVLTLPLLPKYPIVSLFTRENLSLSTHFTFFAHGVLKGIYVFTVLVSKICLRKFSSVILRGDISTSSLLRSNC